jgi:hypothetical protein
MSGRGRKGFSETDTPFEQEKDPLIKRETLEQVRACYKIRGARVRNTRSFSISTMATLAHWLLRSKPQWTFASIAIAPPTQRFPIA